MTHSFIQVFEYYQRLLNSENYVTRRQSLKVCQPLCASLGLLPLLCVQLLGELLLDRHNFTVMSRYISSPDNLKLMMNMLRDHSRNIQFEAFHVFKVLGLSPLPLSIPPFCHLGVCGQPKQDQGNPGHFTEESREASSVPSKVPQ